MTTYGLVSDKGLCLPLGFTDKPPPNAYSILRLCDQTLVIHPKVLELEEGEWPTCPDCRGILKHMRASGVR